jgi:hypothetical protein
MYVGQRKSILSVCKLDSTSSPGFKKAYMNFSPTQNLWREITAPSSCDTIPETTQKQQIL